MAWLKDTWDTLREAAGPRRYVVGAAISSAVGLLDYIQPWLSLGIPSWAAGLMVFLFIVSFWLVDYARKVRLELRGVTDLEKALDELSVYFDEANGNLFNRHVKSTDEYATWRAEWKAWQGMIEEYLQTKFGLRERNIFRNLVLFNHIWIPGIFKEDPRASSSPHNFDRAILAHQLEKIREVIIRHSERAATWRARNS